jgi:hypothetical protein
MLFHPTPELEPARKSCQDQGYSKHGAPMYKLRMFMLFVIWAICLPLAASDWKVAATTDDSKLYVDFGSVSIKNNILNIWVKDIKEKDIHLTLDAHPELIELANKKFHEGYVPPLFDSIGFKNLTVEQRQTNIRGLILYEVAGSIPGTATTYMALYSIDYNTNRWQLLYTSGKDKDGNESINNQPGDWNFIVPDSVMSSLVKMLKANLMK